GGALGRHRLDAGAHFVERGFAGSVRVIAPTPRAFGAGPSPASGGGRRRACAFVGGVSPRAGRRRTRRLELVPGGDAHFVEVGFVGAGGVARAAATTPHPAGLRPAT